MQSTENLIWFKRNLSWISGRRNKKKRMEVNFWMLEYSKVLIASIVECCIEEMAILYQKIRFQVPFLSFQYGNLQVKFRMS